MNKKAYYLHLLKSNQISRTWNSTSEYVVDSIKNSLINRELLPGDKLPSESELSEAFNVSRGSIREAMKILHAYGIVEIKRGDGTYITTAFEGSLIDPLLFRLIVGQNELKDLKEMREMIELGMIRLVIENVEEEDLTAMEESYSLAKQFVEAGDYQGDNIITAEIMFHNAFAKATKNELVKIIYNYVMELYIPKIYMDKYDPSFGEEALTSHRPIIDAIRNKDIKEAEKAILQATEMWKKQATRLRPEEEDIKTEN